jgi:hypothetical protein
LAKGNGFILVSERLLGITPASSKAFNYTKGSKMNPSHWYSHVLYGTPAFIQHALLVLVKAIYAIRLSTRMVLLPPPCCLVPSHDN